MRELSIGVGVSEGYYSMIESGSRQPSTDVAKRIATMLEIDWTLFFDESLAR